MGAPPGAVLAMYLGVELACLKGDLLLDSTVPLGGSEYATFEEVLQTIAKRCRSVG